jgi:hypothetical protein
MNSRPSHDPMEIYSQESSTEVWLQNRSVTVLVAVEIDPQIMNEGTAWEAK